MADALPKPPEESIMASVAWRAEQNHTDDELPPVIWVTEEEERRLFDEMAREWIGISGEEFIQRWEAGEYANIPDDLAHRRHIELSLMIPYSTVGQAAVIPSPQQASVIAREEVASVSSAVRPTELTTEDDGIIDGDDFIGAEEGRQMFDAAVRRRMGISGDEFIRRWEAGEYDGIWDTPGHLHIGDLASLIPFARQDG
jgi:hypothetical protein